jgi:hypothetical protein
MMRRGKSRPERRAALRIQRFHAALGKVVPITWEESPDLEPGSDTVKQKTEGMVPRMGVIGTAVISLDAWFTFVGNAATRLQ